MFEFLKRKRESEDAWLHGGESSPEGASFTAEPNPDADPPTLDPNLGTGPTGLSSEPIQPSSPTPTPTSVTPPPSYQTPPSPPQVGGSFSNPLRPFVLLFVTLLVTGLTPLLAFFALSGESNPLKAVRGAYKEIVQEQGRGGDRERTSPVIPAIPVPAAPEVKIDPSVSKAIKDSSRELERANKLLGCIKSAENNPTKIQRCSERYQK